MKPLIGAFMLLLLFGALFAGSIIELGVIEALKLGLFITGLFIWIGSAVILLTTRVD